VKANQAIDRVNLFTLGYWDHRGRDG